VDPDRATSLYKQISARGRNKSEPGYVAPEKPRDFLKLAEISYGSGPNLPPPTSTNVIEFPFKRPEYTRDRA
jgi:hypothetical protein